MDAEYGVSEYKMKSLRGLHLLLCVTQSVFAQTPGAEPCVFCEIANGRSDQSKTIVYRDQLVIAFMDRAPRNPGHVLVVPKQHAKDILDVPPATLSRVA